MIYFKCDYDGDDDNDDVFDDDWGCVDDTDADDNHSNTKQCRK